MQRLSKKQVFWLALALASLVLLFVLDFPQKARSEEQAPIASGISAALTTPIYAFPLVDISQTTIYKPLNPVAAVQEIQETGEGATGDSNRDRELAGKTQTRSGRTIEASALRDYLLAKKSPLSEFVPEVLASPYWSTIIAICTIEQYGCSRLPGGTNWNLWGIGGSRLARYSTAEQGIGAISQLLEKYQARGYDTIEEMNGYYVQPASENWYRVVTQTKAALEAL